MDDILKIIYSTRFDLNNEKSLQSDIEDVLKRKLVRFEREFQLSKSDIIDFMVNGIGIEVKISGSAKNIYRQIERYCHHDQVKSIILLTNRSMNLPTLINGKPTKIVNLGIAWL